MPSASRSRIERWLAPFLPPAGSIDRDAEEVAPLFAAAALATGLLALTLIPQLLGESTPAYRWAVVVISLIGSGLVLTLVRRGHVLAAGHVYPAIAIGIGALMEFSEGGSSARVTVLMVGVITAGLLVRPVAALGFTAAAIAVVVGARLAAVQGWISSQPAPTEGVWLTSIRMLLLAGILVTLLAASLRRSVDRLRERERELSESLRALSEARALEDAARARLAQAEKLEALGRIAGGVAHDFNNLLTVIVGNASLALDAPGDARPLHEISAAAERGAQLTRQLLAFARQRPQPPRPLNLHDALAALLPVLRRLLGEAVRIEVDAAAPEAAVVADPAQVDRILVNLAVNAQYAMPAGGTLRFATAGARPGWVRLTVSDAGVGMPPEVQARIFEPFFTTRESAGGTGLGLATVHAAVTEMGGIISVDSEPGAGTRFTIELPLAEARAERPLAPASSPAAAAGETILVVDDDATVRSTVRRALEHVGYRVRTAADAEEAVAALLEHGAPLALCLTDVVLASGSGPEVSARIREKQPNLPVLYMSGYTAGLLQRHGVESATDVLTKPFTVAQLGEAVARMLAVRPGTAAG